MGGLRLRVPPALILVAGFVLTGTFGGAWLADHGPEAPPWWGFLFLTLLAVAITALATAVTIDPRTIILRRALAGSALAWLAMLALPIVRRASFGDPGQDVAVAIGVVVLLVLGLLGLAGSTGEASGDPTGYVGRVRAVVAFAVAILVASSAVVVASVLVVSLWRTLTRADPVDRVPWGIVVLVVIVPIVTFAIASIGTRQANGRTFYAQATTNRRNSVLLLITLVGVVAATAEIIAASLTFDPIPALWAAGIAGAIGLAAAAGANRVGANVILDTAGAKPADPRRDVVLLDVVRELALAANVPVPAVYVIEDGSQNAFATGRDPQHAALAVTRGLLERMDREQLQGVIGHEIGHVRNLDTRYALYVAVLVGLVALVTDGFLRLVVAGWREGAFFWSGDDDNGLAALAMGVLVGLFLLIVAGLLWIIAPFFSALVQASTSREREFLADATSVEFTRNANGLERALAALATDSDPLEAANRGTQHLWFRNPVKAGDDGRVGLFATHPSLAARIDRLRTLQGLAPLGESAAPETLVDS